MTKQQSKIDVLTKEIDEVKKEVGLFQLNNMELEVAFKNTIKWKRF